MPLGHRAGTEGIGVGSVIDNEAMLDDAEVGDGDGPLVLLVDGVTVGECEAFLEPVMDQAVAGDCGS